MWYYKLLLISSLPNSVTSLKYDNHPFWPLITKEVPPPHLKDNPSDQEKQRIRTNAYESLSLAQSSSYFS